MSAAAAGAAVEKRELSKHEKREAREQERIAELVPLLEKLRQEDADAQLEGLRDLRRQLQGAKMETVLAAGFVPSLLELAKKSGSHDLQFESLWILTDMTAAEEKHTKAVAAAGTIEVMEQLLRSPSASAREQALNVLANIAAATTELRDKVAASGNVVQDILKMLHVGMANEHQTYYDKEAKVWKLRSGEPEQPVSVTRKGAACVLRLCQGEPKPKLGAQLLQALAVLAMEGDEEVLVSACAALNALDYGAFEKEFMVKAGVDARLGDLASHKNEELSASAKTAAEKLR